VNPVLDTMSDGDHVMKGSSFYCYVRGLCLCIEDIGAYSQGRDGDCFITLLI